MNVLCVLNSSFVSSDWLFLIHFQMQDEFFERIQIPMFPHIRFKKTTFKMSRIYTNLSCLQKRSA